MAIQKSVEKYETWVSAESQLLKISFWDLAHVIRSGTSPHLQILGQIGLPVGSTQIREI